MEQLSQEFIDSLEGIKELDNTEDKAMYVQMLTDLYEDNEAEHLSKDELNAGFLAISVVCTATSGLIDKAKHDFEAIANHVGLTKSTGEESYIINPIAKAEQAMDEEQELLNSVDIKPIKFESNMPSVYSSDTVNGMLTEEFSVPEGENAKDIPDLECPAHGFIDRAEFCLEGANTATPYYTVGLVSSESPVYIAKGIVALDGAWLYLPVAEAGLPEELFNKFIEYKEHDSRYDELLKHISSYVQDQTAEVA